MISRPVGPRSDITSKSGFFASLFECIGKLKGFRNARPEGFERKPSEYVLDESQWRKMKRIFIVVQNPLLSSLLVV
jgi:hypothetical protein